MQAGDDLVRQGDVAGGVKGFVRIGHVDEMVRDRPQVFPGGLVGSDRKSLVDLVSVARKDFGLKTRGQTHGDIGFADARRADQAR